MSKIFSVNHLVLIGAAAMAATLAVLGAGCSDKPKGPTTSYADPSSIQAHNLPYTSAYLNYFGTLTETKMYAVNRTGEVDFILEANNTVHDKESYTYDKTSFNYTGNADEVYSPGVTLLKFPFKTGDSWEWKGYYRLGGRDRSARATITTSGVRLLTLVGEFDTILVVCKLEIESGSIEPVQKEMKFWFAPGKGLIQREIEHSMSRLPMPTRSDDEG